MTERYRHTQVGYLTLAIMLPVLVISAVVGRDDVPLPALVIGAILLLGVGTVFSSMTIVVDDTALESSFTFGVWRRRVPLRDIASVTTTTSAWWEGWGIRVTPRGMLYNVSGTRAVEVARVNGSSFRLGTDQPDALVAAVQVAMGSGAGKPR